MINKLEEEEHFNFYCDNIIDEYIIPFLKLREKFIDHLNKNK